ncbi:uncharacterized protein LOC128894787 [Hylaeus anthracinus]|uniref:uncharacterized protein LOC128894787 n=1 Tax=Hylaeus anthracinus TaxID=313031 RepID=UPI0023B9AA4E|nr:uncharacterized protein LOC128894787 [Hylaeus anthracinus]
MNPQIMLMSVVATVSVAFIGFVAYRVGFRSNDPDFTNQLPLKDNSSLEEDLKDIMAFVPQDDVREIIHRYMKYDTQIGDTVSFINDQRRFISRELQSMPQVVRMVSFLQKLGLDVNFWEESVRSFWKTSPRFIRNDPQRATGGLTVMIDKILQTIPLDELHELLRQKYKYSGSFRRFLLFLRSKDFADLCNALEKNSVLHHHYFWAKESGLEVTFAIELLRDLYDYLTQSLVT